MGIRSDHGIHEISTSRSNLQIVTLPVTRLGYISHTEHVTQVDKIYISSHEGIQEYVTLLYGKRFHQLSEIISNWQMIHLVVQDSLPSTIGQNFPPDNLEEYIRHPNEDPQITQSLPDLLNTFNSVSFNLSKMKHMGDSDKRKEDMNNYIDAFIEIVGAIDYKMAMTISKLYEIPETVQFRPDMSKALRHSMRKELQSMGLSQAAIVRYLYETSPMGYPVHFTFPEVRYYPEMSNLERYLRFLQASDADMVLQEPLEAFDHLVDAKLSFKFNLRNEIGAMMKENFPEYQNTDLDSAEGEDLVFSYANDLLTNQQYSGVSVFFGEGDTAKEYENIIMSALGINRRFIKSNIMDVLNKYSYTEFEDQLTTYVSSHFTEGIMPLLQRVTAFFITMKARQELKQHYRFDTVISQSGNEVSADGQIEMHRSQPFNGIIDRVDVAFAPGDGGQFSDTQERISGEFEDYIIHSLGASSKPNILNEPEFWEIIDKAVRHRGIIYLTDYKTVLTGNGTNSLEAKERVYKKEVFSYVVTFLLKAYAWKTTLNPNLTWDDFIQQSNPLVRAIRAGVQMIPYQSVGVAEEPYTLPVYDGMTENAKQLIAKLQIQVGNISTEQVVSEWNHRQQKKASRKRKNHNVQASDTFNL